MYYDRITRRVHLEIGGEEYLLAFTLGGLEELESKAGKSLISIVTNASIPPIKVLLDGFAIALRDGGNGHRYTKPEAEALAQDIIDESPEGMVGLANVFYATIAASGLIGGKFRTQIFEQLGIEDKDGAPKNARTAKAK